MQTDRDQEQRDSCGESSAAISMSQNLKLVNRHHVTVSLVLT